MNKTPLNAKPDYINWLGNEKAEVLSKLDGWKMPFVEEKLIQSGHSTPENVKEHILWYKQFMSFKVLRPEISAGMFSDIIDGVWHQHILFTHDYEKFGKEMFGEFMHHVPCNIMDMSEKALNEYAVWITDYEEVYGHIPEDLAKELRMSVDEKGPKCTGGSHPGYKCGGH